MAQLERYPDGLRMGELSKRMMVTGGNITGITDQLEQEKLVVRVVDPKDRRVVQRQADAGRAGAPSTTWRAVHEGWIAELLHGVTPDDKTQLIDLLSQMKQQLNADDTIE